MEPKITITQAFDQPLRWVKQNSPLSRYAVATLRLEPLGTLAPAEFVVALPPQEPGGQALSELDLACIDATREGALAYAVEYGVVGVRVSLSAIKTHDVDSNAQTFRDAAKMSMGRAMETYGVPVGQAAPAAPVPPAPAAAFIPPAPPRPAAGASERVKNALGLMGCLAVAGGILAYQWHTRLSAGYYYPKAAFLSAMFAVLFLELLIVGIVRPDEFKARPGRTPAEAQAEMKRTQPALIVALIAAAGAACVNAYFISR